MTNSDTNTGGVQSLFDELRATEGAGGMTYSELSEHYAYSLPESALTFDSVAAVRRAVTASGSHYFDAGAVRYFKGRTDGTIYGRRFWVESRKYESAYGGDNFPREYQVAYVSQYGENLSIEKVGNLSSLPAARKWARRLAAAVNSILEG